MIKKKNNTYKLIKANTPKAGTHTPCYRIFAKSPCLSFSKEHFAGWTSYRRAQKDGFGIGSWLMIRPTNISRKNRGIPKEDADTPTFQLMLEHFNTNYLTKDYFGETTSLWWTPINSKKAHWKASRAKSPAKINPITAGMSPKEIAVRNQREAADFCETLDRWHHQLRLLQSGAWIHDEEYPAGTSIHWSLHHELTQWKAAW